MIQTMRFIGLMSGTSLDGLDVVYVDIREDFTFDLLAARTYPYPELWAAILSSLEKASAYDYALANVRLGHYMGEKVREFIAEKQIDAVDYIASHGHTIFHQPHLGLTTQIGDGDAIAAETGIPVISNFRTLDVALGGQGAPLVPIGDRLFFAQYQACLNLGGIANISYEEGPKGRVAYDICPCNMALNNLARRMGKDYDRDGLTARGGAVVPSLLETMESLEFYRTPAPKSLGKEWFVESFLPLLQDDYATADLLRTTVEHEALRVASVLNEKEIKKLLVSGGGAYNKFLIERIVALAPQCEVTIPDPSVIEYKEAIIFALLGYLRITQQINTLSSVTGARCDSIGGVLSGLCQG